MQHPRREFLKLLSLMAAAGLLPAGSARAEEWNKAAFGSKKLDELIKLLGGSAPQQSDQVALIGPEIAENGAVVPLEVESKLPEHRIDRHPDREEPEHPRRHLHASRPAPCPTFRRA